MLAGKSWDHWIAQYARSHQHPINRLCHTLGIPLIALSVPLFVVAMFVRGFWPVPTVLFAVGWIFQFVGHAVEGKPPEFFHDWRFLFVGLRWWLAKMRGKAIIALIILGSSAGACSRQQAVPAQSVQNPPPASEAAAPAGQPGTEAVAGTVRETLDAATYTYVRVGTDKGDIWAAAPQFAVKVGERVIVPLEMPMQNFHSQSLNRDFPLIYFVSKIRRDGEAAAGGTGSTPALMAGHGTSTPEPAEHIDTMAAPSGGMTIADLWSRRQSLAGKSVTVHGRVVKFNAGILGRNWIHLQDGTGKPADNSNDITVTTPEGVVVKVGDTITATGTVTIDKDFGAGYAYGALLENARVAPK